MQILRQSRNRVHYCTGSRYKKSFYNVERNTGDISLVYNVASGAIAKIKTALWDDFTFSDEQINVLAENGFIVRYDSDEFQEYLNQIACSPKAKPNYFTIIPTTACNAKCFYCYEENYIKHTMNGTIIDKVVEYLASNLMEQQEFVLDWYGGEPLLCVDKIDSIIMQLGQKIDLDSRKWNSSITTNATLFKPTLIEHAVSRWNLSSAHITIDGTETEHNKRKQICLKDVNAFGATLEAIECLLDHGVHVNLRIHLDNENRDSFPQIIESLSHLITNPNLHLFPTFLFPPEYDMPKTYINDDQKEGLFYEVFSVLKHAGYITNYLDAFPWNKKQNCFATSGNKVVIGPDGSLHSCVQEFEGKEWEDDEKFTDLRAMCRGCENCKYFPICIGGCIHNRSLDNTVRSPCVRNRFIVQPLMRLLAEEYGSSNGETDNA